MPLSRWILQLLILAAGIHFFLRFVRSARGSRLTRGLLLTIAIGFVGLWGLSKAFDLEELLHLLHGSTGFLLVALVIVFQQEVRRAFALLGSTSLLGRLVNPAGGDELRRVVRAARSMASRRCGALIAFERQTPLAGFLEGGTQLDAAVTARLLESLFHPGGALHDGGVVVRRDRVLQAGCIFPLPEQTGIDPRLGTRHRAAMGLSEESDAVVLVVSEETGAISLAKGGQLRTVLSADEVEDELRRLMEGGEGGVLDEGGARAGWWRDLAWLPASLLLAAGILYVTHQDIRTSKQFVVQVVAAAAGTPAPPHAGQVLVVLGPGYRLAAGGGQAEVEVRGSRSQIEEIGESLSGIFTFPEGGADELALPLAQVSWQRPVLGIDYEWVEAAPLLRRAPFEERRLPIGPQDLFAETAALDGRYEPDLERAVFEPEPALVLRGPRSDAWPAAGALLAPLVFSREETREAKKSLVLKDEAKANGYELLRGVQVTIPIAPARRDLGTVTKEIALIALDPARQDELQRWSLPAHAQTARFRIETAGLIPADADPGSTVYRERAAAIRAFVEANLFAFVDVSDAPLEGDGQTFLVKDVLRKDWSAELDSLVGSRGGPQDEGALEVRLESDERVRLERRAPPAGSSGESN